MKNNKNRHTANRRSFPSIFRRSMGCRFLAITTAGTYIYRFVCYHPGYGVVAVQPCPSVSSQLHSIYARLCYVSASTRSRSRARALIFFESLSRSRCLDVVLRRHGGMTDPITLCSGADMPRVTRFLCVVCLRSFFPPLTPILRHRRKGKLVNCWHKNW